MSQHFSAWLKSKSNVPGLLGLGIYDGGKPTLVQSCAANVSAPALENAWRCVSETIPVLALNEFPSAGFRFVFGQAFVHCERRSDGTCVGICASRDEKVFSPAELDRLLAEFHAL